MKAIVGAGSMWVPTVRIEDPSNYTPTPEALAAATAVLERIQARHEAECDRCSLCGQLMNRPDDFGLCSKVSESHLQWRARVRRIEKAAAGPRFKKSRTPSAKKRNATS